LVEPIGPVGVRASRGWASARQLWYDALERASPAAYCAWSRRFPERHVVDRKTDLVVEGYPAASNSWVREVFQLTQPGIRVASHLHSAAHVRRAVRLGIPTVVLLRPPLESVASLMARYPDRGYEPRTELARYRRFYGDVRRLSDQVLLVRFDAAINSVGTLVDGLNRKFGCSFHPIDDSSPEFKARVFATLDHWSRQVASNDFEVVTPRPSEARAAAIANAKAAIQDAGARQLAAGQKLYDSLVLAESRTGLVPRAESTEARGSAR
jgi:hypothetical protein